MLTEEELDYIERTAKASLHVERALVLRMVADLRALRPLVPTPVELPKDFEPTVEDAQRWLDAYEKRAKCDHGVTFDEGAARFYDPDMVRKRWPRLQGSCPKGCGYHGIAYASAEHFVAGDW